MEARRTAIAGVRDVLPAVDDHGGDRRPPVLAGLVERRVELWRRVRLAIDYLLIGDHTYPGAFHEIAAAALTDADGIGRAIGDIGHANLAVPVEDAIERLPLVAAEIRVAIPAAAQTTHITGHRCIRQYHRAVRRIGRVAASRDVDHAWPCVTGTEIGLHRRAPGQSV